MSLKGVHTMMFLLLTILVALLSIPSVAQELSVNGQRITYVSMLQLIATPERFDGKLISVIGFLQLGRERDVLYVHEEDATHLILASGVPLDRTDEVGKGLKSLDEKYVKVLGIFRAGGKHTVPFSGNITRIEKCELWSDPEAPISQRVTHFHSPNPKP